MFNPTKLFDKISQLSWYQNAHRQWIEDLNLFQGNKVLDVGCATGNLTSFIANCGFVPTGLDQSENMVKQAKINHKNINFIQGSALELPFEDEVFDSVIAASLLNIIPDKNKLLSELYRTCKRDGQISVLIPAKNFDDNDLLLLQQNRNVSGFSASAMEAWHKNPPKMSVSEVITLFRNVGFTEINSKFYLQKMVVAVTASKPL